MKTILLTGFEPFGGDDNNPSQEIATALDGKTVGGQHKIVAATLPVARKTSLQRLVELMDQYQPEIVIMVGLAAGRGNCVSIEKVAINHDDFKIPDNEGDQPFDVCIADDGPAAYFTRLPIKLMAKRIEQAGVPAMISYSAGTFVCNHVFYGVMHHIESKKMSTRACFVHVPSVGSDLENSDDGLKLSELIEGVRAACEGAIETKNDLNVSAGSID